MIFVYAWLDFYENVIFILLIRKRLIIFYSYKQVFFFFFSLSIVRWRCFLLLYIRSFKKCFSGQMSNTDRKLCILERGFLGAEQIKKRINLGTDATWSKTKTWQFSTLQVSFLLYGEWNASVLISWPYSKIRVVDTILCMNYWPHPARMVFDLCKCPLLQFRKTKTWHVDYWCRVFLISVRKSMKNRVCFFGTTSWSEYLK